MLWGYFFFSVFGYLVSAVFLRPGLFSPPTPTTTFHHPMSWEVALSTLDLDRPVGATQWGFWRLHRGSLAWCQRWRCWEGLAVIMVFGWRSLWHVEIGEETAKRREHRLGLFSCNTYMHTQIWTVTSRIINTNTYAWNHQSKLHRSLYFAMRFLLFLLLLYMGTEIQQKLTIQIFLTVFLNQDNYVFVFGLF